MNFGAYIIALGCAAAIFGAAVLAQHGADDARATIPGNEVLYLPNAALLNHFTGGMSSIIADLLWLRCIQYTATEAKGERSFTWLRQMLDTVVQLDPYFIDAYRYGGIFLAALRTDSDAGLDLLERCIRCNPEAWQLPYEAAMIYLLNRQDDPDSPRRAAILLSMSAATGEAPELVAQLASQLQGSYNLVDIEEQMWRDLLKSEDKFLRQLAERKLYELGLREACRILDERIGQYETLYGRRPDSVAQLTEAGLIQREPADPLGGQFFIDPEGRAQSTTLLDNIQAHNLSLLRDALRRYHEKYGIWPPTLDELVAQGPFAELPPQPYKGQAWYYDPETGEVR